MLGQLAFHWRTRQTVARCVHVMPDHTVYSHLQMLHLLVTGLATTFVAVVLFINQRQCTAEVCWTRTSE